ncbi:Sec63 Brl domain-containing protein [Chaetomium tenue]|uniref:Sec63 Brl domain-containing protein n=1 Tax=Chaetomium tenue TaxID=1854479 RepID=A0ACB7PGU9_9PEZI|nr:Sec63 Brl domain-containing protein [Chaetomium globosum]
MNLKCAELTGDTSQAEMRRVGDASIIVTTPEKWDSITRKWQDHRRLLQMVELFLIDEVHILKDMRGATLEAVVSRMKTIGANVRFIALSATVPNSDDIARWLGRNHTNQQLPAHRETFGEEFRPVKLQKFVYGFDSNSNDFIFDKFLDQKLPGLISKHARQKPILVFCFTRKSCESTAAMLADFASDRPDGNDMWPIPTQRVPVVSRELQEIVRFGVAFHHAGLDPQDRTAIEQNFLKGQLGVICCTSTLAVGINLPCHTAVLKGTVGFTDDQLKEYSDLEVMQMLGRAGRPQFDDSATAIILTRSANKERYQKMVSGQEILESTLHLNLIEHLNSEICLGTIHDLPSAKTWLGGTFLSVRLRRNPNYYRLTGGTTNPSEVDDRLEEICERDIKQLQETKLVTDQDSFHCTEYGRAMSKYMVEFQTMKLLLQIPRGVGMEALITILSQACEFKEFRFKPAERQLFREINQSPLIMYPIKETVAQTQHKVSIVIQAHLGCVQYPDSGGAAKMRRQLMVERKLIFERLNRLVRAVIDCKGYDRDSIGTKTALELARALAAQSWEGRPTQLTQVPSIGPVGMRKLASKDIRTVLQLADKDYGELERLMSRQPPFGKNLQDQLDKFPRLAVEAAVVGHRVHPKSDDPVLVEVKATLRYLNRKGPPNWANRMPALTFLAETDNGTLAYFWRGSIRKLDKQAGLELKFSVGLRHAKDRVFCHFSCEEIVGTIVSTTIEHRLPASVFPVRQVPADGNFGQEYIDNDGLDDSDLILVAEQAVVQTSAKQRAETAPEQNLDDYPSVEELVEMSYSHSADNFDDHLRDRDGEEEMGSTQMATREPVRLPNGKWRCNHPCAGGALTRSGKPCGHRCCKDGLDKPRKRPLQRPKRNAEKPTGDLVNTTQSQFWPSQGQSQQQLQPPEINRAKRQKMDAAPSFTQTTLAPEPRHFTKAPKNDWDSAGFDDLALECIDLSYTDDENDDIFQPLGVAVVTSHGSDANTSTTKGKQALDHAQTTAPTHTESRPGARMTTRQSDYQDDDLDDQDFSLLQDKIPSNNQLIARSTEIAFKSGANDEVLYQGQRGPFANTSSSSSYHATPGGMTTTAQLRNTSGSSSTVISIDDTPGMTSDPSPSSSTAAEPAVSPPKKGTNSISGDTTAKQPRKGNSNEPDWVADFDPEFVDMFRGYVTFV